MPNKKKQRKERAKKRHAPYTKMHGHTTTSSAEPSRIVGIIASRCDTPQRWKYFCHCITSIMEQSIQLHALCIGMSFTCMALQDECVPQLNGLQAAFRQRGSPTDIQLVIRSEPLTQGNMWSLMHAALAPNDTPNTWYLFGDDDDIWHPARVYNYSNAAEMACSQSDKYITDLRCKGHVEEAGWKGYTSHCLLYTSPSPRDGLLSRMPSSA